MNKKLIRIRRAKRSRRKIIELGSNRLSVYRSSKHIYAQIIYSKKNKIIVTASTLENYIKNKLKPCITGNKKAAYIVGKKIAERAIKKGIRKVSFDRSGFLYHGRIKELADAARKEGLIF